MSFITLVLYLVIGLVCAYLVNKVVASTLPGGFTTSAFGGVLGAYLGSAYASSFGPAYEGVSVLPAIVGAAVVIFVTSYVGRFMHKSA